MAYRIECIDVSKRFCEDAPPVLKEINWTVEPGRVVGLVGASGAGKTTLLRIIAGLECCSGGRVVLSPQDSVDARRPTIGMVFQNLALWPHLTARRQVEYVLGGLPRRQRRERAATVLKETRLLPAAWDRRPAELSGGEAQRLALARALAAGPGILLLDEPLAQLDAPLRGEMLDLVTEVIDARGVTTVLVTHHAAEAMMLGDRIAVVQDGRIEMEGAAEEVFWQAPSLQIARLTGPLVRLPRSYFAEKLVAFNQGSAAPAAREWADDECIYVRPQQLRLVGPGEHNQWKVADCRPDGADWRLALTCGSHRIAIVVPQAAGIGQSVAIEVKSRPSPDRLLR